LEEGAGELLILPGRGRLAGAQANDRILHADRHSGLHPQIADDAVALVEKADDRDPVLHRGNANLLSGAGTRLGKLDPVALVPLVLAALAAGREK
jgi:hypothetical protein